MKHLNRRFKHLNEFKYALIRSIEAARITVGVRIALGEGFKLADVDLPNKRRNILIVLIAGFGFCDCNLAKTRGLNLHHPKSGDVAPEGLEPLKAPRAHQGAQTTPRNTVLFFDNR